VVVVVVSVESTAHFVNSIKKYRMKVSMWEQ
jgi:hypothetical protein